MKSQIERQYKTNPTYGEHWLRGEREAGGRAAACRRTDRVGLRVLVGHHQSAVADDDFGMTDTAIFTDEARAVHLLCGGEDRALRRVEAEPIG